MYVLQRTTPEDMMFIWRCIRNGIDGKYDFESRYAYLKVLTRAQLGDRR